jgi:hypothetical protein
LNHKPNLVYMDDLNNIVKSSNSIPVQVA